MVEIVATVFILLTFLGTVYPMRDLPKGALYLYNENPLVAVKYDIKPFSDFNDANVVKQKFDYSCGSAALATLLNYSLGENLSEEQVMQGMFQYGDSALIEQRRAFSLLDMKKFVEVLGYKGAGYTADLEDLKKLKSPAIVPIQFYGYTHFVVYKGMYRGHIFFADPFLGNSSYPISRFQEMWFKNVVFVVSDGERTMSALRLKDQDLRIIRFDIGKEQLFKQFPSKIIADERRYQEALGEVKYFTDR
jgi:predicted double-glycine peptidase